MDHIANWLPTEAPSLYIGIGTLGFFIILAWYHLSDTSTLHEPAWWPKGYAAGQVHSFGIGALTVLFDLVVIGGDSRISLSAKMLAYFSAGLILGYGARAIGTKNLSKRLRERSVERG